MLEESIRKIKEAEKQAEQDKANCRAELQRMLMDAQREADQLALRAEETLHREQAELLDRAEKEAAAVRNDILQKVSEECDLLRGQARQNSGRAIEYILTKGV